MRRMKASALTSTELLLIVESPAGLNQAAPASRTVATTAPPVRTASRPTRTGSTLPACAGDISKTTPRITNVNRSEDDVFMAGGCLPDGLARLSRSPRYEQ